MSLERLQKIIAQAGLCSRRAAEDLIVQGRVRVNGRVVQQLGARADAEKDRIDVDGKRIASEDRCYVLLHKPRGVVATMHDPQGRPTVAELVSVIPERLFPVGRLDYATSGVLLLTNDGAFAQALLHPRRAVPKIYVVKCDGRMREEDLAEWRRGVDLEDGRTLPAAVDLLRYEGTKTWLRLTIVEGRNQQIRRMAAATGFPALRLARVSFAGLNHDDLRPGFWRPLSVDELRALRKAYGVPARIRPQHKLLALLHPKSRSSARADGRAKRAPRRRRKQGWLG